MTLLEGKPYCFETFDQFCRKFNVTYDEIIKSLPPSDQSKMLEECNTTRRKDGYDPVDNPTQLSEQEISEYLTAFYTDTQLIDSVLESRDKIYTRIPDISVHRVMEINPEQPSGDNTIYSVFEMDAPNRSRFIGTVRAPSYSDAQQKAKNEFGAPVEVRKNK